MPAYSYYLAENVRHRDMKSIYCSKEQVLEIVAALCRFRGLPPIEVRFHKPRKSRTLAWYQPPSPPAALKKRDEHLSFYEDKLAHLTVCHEFAHYQNWQETQAKKRDAERQRLISGLVQNKAHRASTKENWHGPEHARLTDEAVDFVKSRGWHLRAADAPKSHGHGAQGPNWTLSVVLPLLDGRNPQAIGREEMRALNVAAEAAYLATLPETLNCPCCKKDLPRETFGARIMGRNPQGLPTRVRRQSYCRPCRHQK